MYRSFIIAAGMMAMATTASAGKVSESYDGVVKQVSGFMLMEAKKVQATVLESGIVFDCGCPKFCDVVVAIAGGQFQGFDAELAMVIALQEDLTGGIAMGLKNNGKFDPGSMEGVRLEAKYADGVKPEEISEMIKAAAGAVLN